MPGGQFVGDRASTTQGPGQAVELGDHWGVARSAGGQCLAKSGLFPVGAGQAVVDVGPLGLDAKAEEAVALGGQVLLIGGASGVPDE